MGSPELAFAVKAINEASKTLKTIEGDIGGLATRAEKSSGKMAKFGKAIGGVAKVAGGFIIAQGLLKLPGLFSGIATQGAALELQMEKANTVFGDQIPIVNEWARESANAMGLTKTEATTLAAGMADLLIPMGMTREQAALMSTETVGLAGALAEWSGGQISAEGAAQILSKAMLGERESLKTLGISITEADIKTRLAAKGQDELTGSALQQAKAIATQELIFEKSTDAQAAFAEGGEKAARAQAIMGAKMRELKESIVLGLMPAVIKIGQVMLKFAEFVERKVIPVLKVEFKNAVEGAKRAFEAIRPHLDSFKRAIEPILPPLKALFEKGLKVLIDNREALIGVFAAVAIVIVAALVPAVVSLMIALAPLIVAIAVGGAIALGITLLIKNFDEVKEAVTGFADAVPGLNYVLGLAKDAIGDVISFVENIVTVIENVVQLISALASGDWSEAWTQFKELAVSILNLFVSWLTFGFIDEIVTVVVDAVPKLLEAGGKLFQGLIDGIMDKWDNVLKLWFVDLPILILETIGDLLATLAPVGFDLLIGLLNGAKDAFLTVLKLYFVALPMLIFDTIGDVAATLFSLGKDLLQGLFDGVKEHWQTILMVFFGGLPGLILAVLIETGIATKLVQAGKDLLQGLFDGVKNVWTGVLRFFAGLPGAIVTAIGNVGSRLFNKGKELIQGLIDGMLSLPIPNPLDLIPDLTPGFDVPVVPWLAHGGPALAGRSYIIGERGPELFRPASSGTIIPNSALSRLPSLGGAGRALASAGRTLIIENLTVVHNGPFFGDEVELEQSARILRAKMLELS